MSSKYAYQPFYNEDPKQYLCRISFSKFSWTTVSLPFFAFIFCVCWSVLFNFEDATYTHCHVYNVLPSISAAIGSFTPQREVWQTAIGLQALPRLLVTYMYSKYNREVLYPWAYGLSRVACTLNFLENISLVGLSFWTSSSNYPIHKTCFVTFIITSELYMILSCLLYKRCRRLPVNTLETRSLKTKFRLMLFNITNILLASYFFMRHNSYCEPMVYSCFAFFEYMVVLSNMAFHLTFYWDFYGRDLIVKRSCEIDVLYR